MPLDKRTPRPRLEQMFGDAGVRVVVTASADAHGFDWFVGSVLPVMESADAGHGEAPIVEPRMAKLGSCLGVVASKERASKGGIIRRCVEHGGVVRQATLALQPELPPMSRPPARLGPPSATRP